MVPLNLINFNTYIALGCIADIINANISNIDDLYIIGTQRTVNKQYESVLNFLLKEINYYLFIANHIIHLI